MQDEATRAGAEGAHRAGELIDETWQSKNGFIIFGEQGRERHRRYRHGFEPEWGRKQKQRAPEQKEVWEDGAQV